MTRYQGWRRGKSGYSGGCTQDDIDNEVSAVESSEKISGVGWIPAWYTVTNIEDNPAIDSSKFVFASSFTDFRFAHFDF